MRNSTKCCPMLTNSGPNRAILGRIRPELANIRATFGQRFANLCPIRRPAPRNHTQNASANIVRGFPHDVWGIRPPPCPPGSRPFVFVYILFTTTPAATAPRTKGCQKPSLSERRQRGQLACSRCALWQGAHAGPRFWSAGRFGKSHKYGRSRLKRTEMGSCGDLGEQMCNRNVTPSRARYSTPGPPPPRKSDFVLEFLKVRPNWKFREHRNFEEHELARLRSLGGTSAQLRLASLLRGKFPPRPRCENPSQKP